MAMKRTQIMIDEDLDAELGRRARREGTSKAALIRAAVRRDIGAPPGLEDDPLWEMVGIDDGEPVDDIDAVIYDRRSSEDPGG